MRPNNIGHPKKRPRATRNHRLAHRRPPRGQPKRLLEDRFFQIRQEQNRMHTGLDEAGQPDDRARPGQTFQPVEGESKVEDGGGRPGRAVPAIFAA
jgi:hypothetical protein